jgi:hypothetical protein
MLTPGKVHCQCRGLYPRGLYAVPARCPVPYPRFCLYPPWLVRHRALDVTGTKCIMSSQQRGCTIHSLLGLYNSSTAMSCTCSVSGGQ